MTKKTETSKTSENLRQRVLRQVNDVRTRIDADSPGLLDNMREKLQKETEPQPKISAAKPAPWLSSEKTQNEPIDSEKIDKRKNLETIKQFLSNETQSPDLKRKLLSMLEE